MSFLKLDKENIPLYSDLFKEMNSETDRGIVLISSEFLSHCLEILLKSFMIKSKETDKLFETFQPLSSFSSRINVSLSCGLISREEYNELNVIRKIRNRSAHSFQEFSLDKNNVQNLSEYKRHKNIPDHPFSKPKNILTNTVIQLSDSILKRSQVLKPVSFFQKKSQLEPIDEYRFLKRVSDDVNSTPGLKASSGQTRTKQEGHRYKGYYVNSWTKKWMFFGLVEEFQDKYWNESFVYDTPYWIELSENIVSSCDEKILKLHSQKEHPRYKNRVVIPFSGINRPENVGNTIRILSVLSGSDYRVNN